MKPTYTPRMSTRDSRIMPDNPIEYIAKAQQFIKKQIYDIQDRLSKGNEDSEVMDAYDRGRCYELFEFQNTLDAIEYCINEHSKGRQ